MALFNLDLGLSRGRMERERENENARLSDRLAALRMDESARRERDIADAVKALVPIVGPERAAQLGPAAVTALRPVNPVVRDVNEASYTPGLVSAETRAKLLRLGNDAAKEEGFAPYARDLGDVTGRAGVVEQIAGAQKAQNSANAGMALAPYLQDLTVSDSEAAVQENINRAQRATLQGRYLPGVVKAEAQTIMDRPGNDRMLLENRMESADTLNQLRAAQLETERLKQQMQEILLMTAEQRQALIRDNPELAKLINPNPNRAPLPTVTMNPGGAVAAPARPGGIQVNPDLLRLMNQPN